jgi:hypothetical protein
MAARSGGALRVALLVIRVRFIMLVRVVMLLFLAMVLVLNGAAP